MDNNRLNALLKRDTDTVAGLLADQPNYKPLEEDMGPLRDEHAENLGKAKLLEEAVFADDEDDSAQVKTGTRKLLKPLATRLAAAIQAYAASGANTADEDLASRVPYGADSIGRADDGSFASIVGTLLREGQPLATQLAKREFSADDLAMTETLLKRFTRKRTQQRLTLVEGGTDRKTLLALLKRNSALIKKMRVQLKPYQNSPTKHDVWLRFVGYTKIINYSGGGSPQTPDQKPAPTA